MISKLIDLLICYGRDGLMFPSVGFHLHRIVSGILRSVKGDTHRILASGVSFVDFFAL
jgi:uncharacterized protein YjhX (UPF0386 family)